MKETNIILESAYNAVDKYINEGTELQASDIQSPFEYLSAGNIEGFNKLQKSVISRYYQQSLSKQICDYVPMIGPTGKVFLTTKNATGDRKVVSASGKYELNTIQSRVTPEFMSDVFNTYKVNGIEFVSKMITQDMLETIDALVVQRIKTASKTDSLAFSSDTSIADSLKIKSLNIKISNIIASIGFLTKRGYRSTILVSPKVAAALFAGNMLLRLDSLEENRDFIGLFNGIHRVFIDTNDYLGLGTTSEGALIMHDGDFVGDRPMIIGAYSNLLFFSDDYSVTENALMIRNRQMFLRNPIDTQIFGNTTSNSSAFSTFLTVDFSNIASI